MCEQFSVQTAKKPTESICVFALREFLMCTEDTKQIDMDTMKYHKHWHVHIYIIHTFIVDILVVDLTIILL